MAYIGKEPTAVPLTSTDLNDGIITSAKIADGTIALADLSATGTKDATTFLRGDNSFAEAGGGKVLQVVTNESTSTFSTTSTTFTYVSGMPSLSITPSSTSSKILLFANLGAIEIQDSGDGYVTFFRDSTDLGNSTFGFISHQFSSNHRFAMGTINHLDSPSSTSSLTYQLRVRSLGTQFIIGNSCKISITAIEIGA